MKTYNEKTLEEIESPDLSKGMTYPGKIKTGVEYVVMSGSQEKYPPNGLRKEKAVYEECQFYHAWTEEELAAQNEKTVDEKISDAVTAAVALAQGGAV